MLADSHGKVVDKISKEVDRTFEEKDNPSKVVDKTFKERDNLQTGG